MSNEDSRRGDAFPTYDISRTYRWNYEHAPGSVPQATVPAATGEWTFCGRRVPSPLGIAAGPLLNGRWVLHYAALGFDVLTYKTVRSQLRECYALPNLQPVRAAPLHSSGSQLDVAESMGGSWAISFGMPSMAPDVWRADVEWTRARLPKEKVLSVSVVATAQPGWTQDDLADDFARCARWAVESGADCVETNFSCPNVSSLDGQLFQQPPLAAYVAQRVREAIGTTPLLVKLGFVESDDIVAGLIDRLAPFADALVMTNCIAATVRERNGSPLFGGEPRGIGGEAIRAASVEQVRRFAALGRQRGKTIKLIGVGGISHAAHVREYLAAGAEAVQIATAAMVDPLLGCRILRDL